MPLSLNVSHSKKVGLPNYGSQGACCSLGIELDGSLLRDDPKKFRHEVREAFIACREAVEEELARGPAEQPAGQMAAHSVQSASACSSTVFVAVAWRSGG